jgi:hypothetical protein
VAVWRALLMAAAPARPRHDRAAGGRRAGRGPAQPNQQPADFGDGDGDRGGTVRAAAPLCRALIVTAASASRARVLWRRQPRQRRTS